MRGDFLFVPTLAFALAMAVLFAGSAARLARALDGTDRRWLFSALLLGILLIADLTLFFLGLLPPIFLFVGIWIAAFAAFGAPKRFSKRAVLTANAIALCLILACSLLVFGHLSVLEARGANADILVDTAGLLPAVQVIVSASLLLGSGFALILARTLEGAYPATDRGALALEHFHGFVAFAIVYELMDLTPLSFGTWFDFMPYFLFGGSVLLTLFFAVFSVSTAFLGAEAFRESENIALERRKRDEEMLARLYRREATTDLLTGLNARRVGQEHLAQLDDSRAPYLVAFIDVNGLKSINDAFGHAVGDECLQAFSRALSREFSADDTVRWGGDEFLVIIETDDGGECALNERLDALSARFDTPEGPKPIRFCYGTASSKLGGAEAVLRLADERMYGGKRTVNETCCRSDAE